MSERKGNWMQTVGGRAFHVLDPRPEDVDIQDIAHALSMTCRFGGHVTKFYCPTPEQRVLTADLRWVPAGDLVVGDELLGFDEHLYQLGGCGKPRRRFRHARVLASVPVQRRVIRLEMADGASIRASSEHPWLVATKVSRNQAWRTTAKLASDLALGRRRYMHRFVEPWAVVSGRDAGWLAGLYDGEGCLSTINRKGIQLGVSQRPGLVLDEIGRILSELGFLSLAYSQTGGSSGDVMTLQMRGGWREVARLLGVVRPIRLLDKFVTVLRSGSFDKQMAGLGTPSEIVRAYDEGEQTCAGIETSTRTYLCEGFGAHNSVADHSIRVSRAIAGAGGTVAEQFEGLMHDAAEAYVGDVVWPLKQAEEMAGYKRVERLVEAAIADRFGLPHVQSPIVKRFDLVLLSTEKRDLMRDGVGREDGAKREGTAARAKLGAWHSDAWDPLPGVIEPMSPETARLRFLDLFFDLRGVR